MTADAIPAGLAEACRDVRAAVKADAVGGVVPRFVAAPASTEEAAAVLRAAAELGLAVVPRGDGTRLDWGAPPIRCDLVVETRRLDAVLEHAAGDLVVRAQAGVRLADLAEVLGGAGQRLALDPPAEAGEASGGGTVGGLVATGVAGPLRLRFGLPRDLLLGITMVRADGTVARAGGKVVKNVAGYDIGKLLAGSYGTLGLITEVTFRLHPRPPAAAYVSLTCPDARTAAAAVLSAAASPLAPAAVELDWPPGDAPVGVAVLLEGDADGVAERAERMRAILTDGIPARDEGSRTTAGATDGTADADEHGAEAGDDAEAAAGNGGIATSPEAPPWWGRGMADGGGTVLRVGFWSGQLAGVLIAIREAGRRAGLDPAISGSGAAGVLHAALPADAAADAVAEFTASLRAAPECDPAGAAVGPRASAIILHAPPAVRDAVDMWGLPSSVDLMRAVKDQFDPEHRMAPGRFAGGI
jgi:glycolate oxidase FAD binding subunit